MTKPVAILIDDEPDIRELLSISLERMGLECLQAGSFSEGINLISATKCDLCITDVRMPDGSGIDLVKRFKAAHPDTPIAVMTAFDTTEIAVKAMKAGAFDFLAKPIRSSRLETLVQDLSLAASVDSQEIKESSDALVGNSETIQQLRDSIVQAARSMAPVMIQGEAGSGKELTARSIHNLSLKKYGPFISLDCTGIPQELLESEFFGHEKDSFPEARNTKIGLFQSAHGGSLFLNEVSSLPLHFQAKLLAALKERRVTRLGSQASEPIDVRIFTGTKTNLEAQVQAGNLREDLYYHLNVIDMTITPLRERKQDVALICEQILGATSTNGPIRLSKEASKQLEEYSFPGNVSELENILRRAQAASSSDEITVGDLQFPPSFALQTTTSHSQDYLNINDLEGHLADIEREIITQVLDNEKWNQTKAARRLGLTPRQFRYKLTKHGLGKND